MRIGLVGGVFNPEYEQRRSLFLSVPETLLEELLRKAGHEVVTFPLASSPRADVDLFHIHHFGPAAIDLCLLQKRRPVIFTSHDPFIASRYRSCGFGKWWRFRTLFSLVLGNADGVVALSHAEARVFQEDFKVPANKIRVIHNGLPLRLYQEPKPEVVDHRPLNLLSVGQLEEFKGHVYLLEAIAHVLAERPGCVRLTLVSQNPRLLPMLKAFCEQKGIAADVTFEGSKSTPELVGNYQACDIYVQPSLAESFPITVMEAQACGRPVIASEIAGIPEQVLPGSGLLVPPGDVQALSRALTRLIDNPQDRIAMGQAARRRALALYDPSRLYKQHIDLYEEIIGRPVQPVSPRYWLYRGLLRAWLRMSKYRGKPQCQMR